MSDHTDTSVGALIARYKKIVADLERIQQTTPDAVINTYLVYEHGQITPLLLTKNDVITDSDASADNSVYNKKSTYLEMDIIQTPYEMGSLVFVPVSKEEDFQLTYKNLELEHEEIPI